MKILTYTQRGASLRGIKKGLGLLILCGCTYMPLQAQGVAGYVADSTGQSIPWAHIIKEGSSYGTISNGYGYYYLSLPTGRSVLIFSSIGYVTHSEEVFIEEKDTLRLNIRLSPGIHGLPEVQIYADRRGLRSDFVAGSAYYLSSKDLRSFAHTDVGRVLRAVPGMHIQEEEGFGLRPNIGMRGTGSLRTEKITVMEDGILMAPAPYAAPAAYYFPSIGRISGVEVIKGSSQIQYGPHTTGGAINLLSTPIPEQLEASVDARGGNFSSYRTYAKVGYTKKHIGFLVETQQAGSRGFKELQQNAQTGFLKQDYVAKLRLQSDPKATALYHYLQIKAGYMRERSHETYLGLTQVDYTRNPYMRYAGSEKDLMKAHQQQYSAQYGLQTGALKWKISAYYNHFKRNWYKLDKVLEGTEFKGISSVLSDPEQYNRAYATLKGQDAAAALRVKANNRSYPSYGLQQDFSTSWGRGILRHQWEGVLRYHYDEMDRFQGVDTYHMRNQHMQLSQAGTLGTESNRIESARALSAYTRYNLQVDKRWLLMPGLRYEHIRLQRRDYGKKDPKRTGTKLSTRSRKVQILLPGIGLHYFLAPYLKTFFGLHKGFSPPDSRAETQPEESLNYELGARLSPKATQWTVVLFYNDYKNLLGSALQAAGTEDSSPNLHNGGRVRTKGIELQGRWEVLHSKHRSLLLEGNYTLTEATFRSSFKSNFSGWGEVQKGDHLPYVAPHQGTLISSFKTKKYAICLQASYTAAMRTQAGKIKNEALQTDALLNMDLNTTYIWNQRLSMYINVLNMTGQTALVATRPAGLRPNMPRSMLIGLQYRWQ